MSSSDIAKVIKLHDVGKMVETMNQVKRVSYKSEIVPYVESLWFRTAAGLSEDDWSFLNLPRVRLEVADVLVQASKNGMYSNDRKVFVEYARRYVGSNDLDAARQAIIILGVNDDRGDQILLTSIGLEENNRTSDTALVLLAGMCLTDGESGDILSKLKSKKLRSLFAKARTSQQVLQANCK